MLNSPISEQLSGRDIRQLGSLLDDTIRAQHGDDAFDRIESIRKRSVGLSRDRDQAAQDEPHGILSAMSSDDAAHSARRPPERSC